MTEKQTCKIDKKTNSIYCGKDKPIRPALCYTGGKSKLADKIIKLMPEHNKYVESFMGGGAIFFKKPLANENVLNDKDSNIIKIHKELQKGLDVSKCDLHPSREKFESIKNKKNKTACDILYLNKLSYGCQGRIYSISKTKRRAKDTNITYQVDHNKEYQEKLKHAKILNQDFKKVAKDNDGKNTLHYIDPPYVVGGNSYDVHGVTPKDVCDTAKQLKGNVIISYDNHKDVKKACKGMKFRKVNTEYTIAGGEYKPVKELLITNF